MIMEGKEEKSDSKERLHLYLAITALLAVLAIAASLLMPDTSTKSGCLSFLTPSGRYSCLSRLAASTRNSTLCSIIPSTYADYAGRCYLGVGLETLNYSLCADISDNASASSCALGIANATGSAEPCSILGGAYKDSCVTRSAVNSLDKGSCAYASNSSSAYICSSAVGFSMAAKFRNASYCAEVQPSSDQNITGMVLYYSNTGISPESPVGYIESSDINLSARDLCYIDMASILRNGSYCNELHNATSVSICNSTLSSGLLVNTSAVNSVNASKANYTQMLNECPAGSSYSLVCRDNVLLFMAIETRNASVCTGLGPNLSISCYDYLAQTYGNVTYCAYLSNATENSACVESIGHNLSAASPYS